MGRAILDPANLSAWANVALAVVALVALVLAWQQLRQSREQTKVAHLLDLEARFTSSPILDLRAALAKKKVKGEEEPAELYDVLDFFETVGLLVKRGYLDKGDVWETFGYDVLHICADSKESIEKMQQDDPPVYSHFIALAAAVRAIEASHDGALAKISPGEVKAYWKHEASNGSDPQRGRTRKR